jgi:hypothetical protein
VRCGHCGAPEYGIVNGRCRYCGTSAPAEPVPSTPPVAGETRVAGVAAVDERAWEQAWVRPPVRQRRPYPLSYSGSASYIWGMTAGHTTWRWVVAAAAALPVIGVAWYMILCWRLVAGLVYRLDRRQEWLLTRWVLRMGSERPWFGFALGSVVGAAVLLLIGPGLLQHL